MEHRRKYVESGKIVVAYIVVVGVIAVRTCTPRPQFCLGRNFLRWTVAQI